MKEEKFIISVKALGSILGFLFSIISLFAAPIFKNDIERNNYIAGWIIGFFVNIVVAIILVVVWVILIF